MKIGQAGRRSRLVLVAEGQAKEIQSDVNVIMSDGLARGRPGVEADVVTLWLAVSFIVSSIQFEVSSGLGS